MPAAPAGHSRPVDLVLWSSWPTAVGAAVGGAVVYVAALLACRLAGRRTLAQLSAFDIVVTIAIGSIAASTAVPHDAGIADGILVLLSFIAMQTVVGALRQRVAWFRRLTDFAPEVVVRDGRVDLSRSLVGAQMTIDELHARLRTRQVGDVGEVVVAILEADGSVTVSTGRTAGPLFDVER